jgi:LacI family transcriptional regulator
MSTSRTSPRTSARSPGRPPRGEPRNIAAIAARSESSGKVISLQDIADVVGLHKSTVNRALAGDSRVAADTVARIRAVAEQLQYDPQSNQAARSLSLRKSGRTELNRTVAVFFSVTFSRSGYFHRQFAGLHEVMTEARTDVVIRVLERNPGLRLPGLVTRGEVDAVLAIDEPERLEQHAAALATLPDSTRRPFITLINPIPGAWNVTADFAAGGQQAMAHLLDLGHRRIITIDNMSYQHAARVAGNQAELRHRGLDPARHLIGMSSDKSVTEVTTRVAEVLDRLLAAAPDATAFLAPNDQAAGMAVEHFRRRGLDVPRDISVIGFDDTDAVLDANHDNLLTSVALPLEDIGREAARMALNPGPKPRQVVLPVSLHVRGSTAAPRAKH